MFNMFTYSYSAMFSSHPIERTLLILFLSILTSSAYSQTSVLTLSFAAENNGQPVQLSGIKAMNLTHGGETSITSPATSMTLSLLPGDTILFIGYSLGYQVGMEEAFRQDPSFSLSQLYPDPGTDKSRVALSMPKAGKVELSVTDFQGRNLICREEQLEKGIHSFEVSTAAGSLCFLTARWNGISRNIKIAGNGTSISEGSLLEYSGKLSGEVPVKPGFKQGNLVKLETGILDTPTSDRKYLFQFAYNVPCPGIPTITYEGQEYHTVQIYSQCWLKENLNVGTMLEICADQTDNGYLEKYCYSDNEDSCTKYGGLYQWDEMMQYTTQQGARGICPPGWHVPSRDEWNVLIGTVDTHYEIDVAIKDIEGVFGFDGGTNLKSDFGWEPYSFGHFSGNGTDYFGFTGLPGGYRDFFGCGNYGNVNRRGYWWSSTEITNEGLTRANELINDYTSVARQDEVRRNGYSVRCLKDQE